MDTPEQDAAEKSESETREEEEAPTPLIARRLGKAPQDREDYDPEENPGACPDVFMVEGGLLIIGQDVTDRAEYLKLLPTDASVGDGERLVFVPDEVAQPALKDYTP